jgi:hypothetical protein
MKVVRIPVIALLAGVALWTDASAQETTGRAWMYQYLLATAYTERELAPVTETIIKGELPDTGITDVAAEVLLARMNESSFPLQNKIRLTRVLDAAKTRRYAAVLARVQEQASDKEIVRWARAANRRRITNDEVQYVPGTIDIRRLVADMDAAALAARPTTAQGRHLAQFPGGSIDDLFARAGRPQQIVSGQTRVTDGLFINVKVQRVSFFYRGLGRVVYGYRRLEGDWLFQAVVADPLAFEEEFSYRDRAQQLGMPDSPTLEMIQLLSGYTAAMKNALEINYRRAAHPLEFMDTAAEILITGFKDAHDPVTVDMYAWICRLLTQHGGQRYAALLERVAAETGDEKLRRFAQLPIEKTSEVTAAPYAPGTTSLDAQRAKYPVLYPDSTFQSGRL